MKRYASAPGFLTVISVFLIVALISAGGLACAVTSGGSVLTDRSARHLSEYRRAYNESERRLAAADGCIAAAASTGLFDMNFEAEISELEYIQMKRLADCYLLSCTTPVDEKTAVYWEIRVPLDPGGRRGSYELVSRRTVDISAAESDEEEHLNVWQG